MQLSPASLLYALGLAVLVGLRPVARYLVEAAGLVVYVGFIGVGYVVTWVVVHLKELRSRRGRPG